MKNIIFALDELIKKPLFTFLTIIQLVISFVLIFVAISNSNSINDKLNIVDDIFKDKNYYVLDVSDMLPLENVQIEKLYKFNEYIKNNEDIELYSVSNDSVFIAKDNLPISFFSNFDSFILENKQFQRVGLIFLNDKYLDNMGIKLSEGSFDKQKSEYESVVLGDEYKVLFNINDIIPYNYSEVNGEKKIFYFQVKGFIKRDSMLCIGGDVNNLINTNKYIIALDNGDWINNQSNDEMVKKIQIFNSLKNGYFNVKNDLVLEKINEYSKNLGLNYKLKSQGEQFSKSKEELQPMITLVKTLSIIILFFTNVSIIVVILNAIIDNTKQYAINMLVGATKNDMAMRVFFEIAILFSISLGVAMVIIYKFVSDNIAMIVNFKNIFELIFVAYITCIFISIIPIIKLKELSINNMIKGGSNLW